MYTHAYIYIYIYIYIYSYIRACRYRDKNIDISQMAESLGSRESPRSRKRVLNRVKLHLAGARGGAFLNFRCSASCIRGM